MNYFVNVVQHKKNMSGKGQRSEGAPYIEMRVLLSEKALAAMLRAFLIGWISTISFYVHSIGDTPVPMLRQPDESEVAS